MLREAAARRWGVPADRLQTSNATVLAPDGSRLTYAELAAEAANLTPPDDIALKAPSDFTLIGTSLPRLDVPDKVTGRAIFGMDAGPADSRVAVIVRPPVFGGRLRSFDATEALSLPGVAIGMIFIFVIMMGEFATAVVVYGGKASTTGTVILNYYAIANYPFAAVNALMLMLAMMVGVVIILRLVDIRKEI